MNKNIFHSMTLFKKLHDITLYKKEQLLICIMVLCFVLSGFILPRIKLSNDVDDAYDNSLVLSEDSDEVLQEENASDSSASEETPNSTVESDDSTNANNDAEHDISDENNSSNEDTMEKPPKEETPEENSSVSNETMTSPPSNNSSSENETPSKDPVSDPKPPKDTEDTDSSDDSDKIWVPPVYEIIHHEAVYETKRVTICNYCEEVFDTVGQFQVHKNENGG